LAGYIGSCIDITELKEAEEKLRQSEERYRLVVENTSDLIWLCDPQGTKLYVSPSFTSVLGYTSDEVFQMPPWTLVHPDDLPLAQALGADIAKGKGCQAIYRYHHKGGRWLVFETRGTPIFDQEGQPSWLVFTAHDITERVELEQRKDEFIGMASHELKTPVTSIKTFTQVLANRSKKRGDEEALRFLIRMEVQLNNLIRFIGDLLDLTRIQTGKLFLHKEVFALDQLVVETIENLQGTTQTHQLLLEQCIPIQVYGDRDRIMQVLFNLLTNAIKYSPHAKKVLLRVEKEGDQAMVSVQDFGIGIAQDQQTKIFERFYQAPNDRERTYPGLGIGLHISHEIIKRHGGKIWVNSNKGKGSIFRVMLPLQKEVCDDKVAEKDYGY
jgi:PAS domain S-box-containing protein